MSVKAYFALKLTGHDPEPPYMRRAREVILDARRRGRCNSFTKFYLALLGQFPYENCASVPPEMMLLPRWFYFNLYAMSSWTRTIVVPLSIFSAHKPVRTLPAEQGHRASCSSSRRQAALAAPADAPLAHLVELLPRPSISLYKMVRSAAGSTGSLRRPPCAGPAPGCASTSQDSDGVGAIFPPMIYTVIVLRCLGVRRRLAGDESGP